MIWSGSLFSKTIVIGSGSLFSKTIVIVSGSILRGPSVSLGNCVFGNFHFILTVRLIYDSYKWFQFIRGPGKVETYICLLKYKWDTENGKTRIKYLVSILESMAWDFFQSMVYN